MTKRILGLALGHLLLLSQGVFAEKWEELLNESYSTGRGGVVTLFYDSDSFFVSPYPHEDKYQLLHVRVASVL